MEEIMAKGVLQTVDRALQLLEILAEHPQGLPAKELEGILELNKITIHRLVTTLESRGFIEKVGSNYRIGLKMVELSSIKLNSIELKTEAAPYLRELVNILKQPVQLAILEGNEAIFIEKIQSVNSLRMYSQIGRRIPLYCSGVGKVLMLQDTDEEVLAKLSKGAFKKFTHTTLESPQEVLEEVRTARESGYAVDNEEHEEGIFCMAVPIYDYRGKIIAAISTAGQNKAFIENPDEDSLALMKKTAAEISKRLGYNN